MSFPRIRRSMIKRANDYAYDNTGIWKNLPLAPEIVETSRDPHLSEYYNNVNNAVDSGFAKATLNNEQSTIMAQLPKIYDKPVHTQRNVISRAAPTSDNAYAAQDFGEPVKFNVSMQYAYTPDAHVPQSKHPEVTRHFNQRQQENTARYTQGDSRYATQNPYFTLEIPAYDPLEKGPFLNPYETYDKTDKRSITSEGHFVATPAWAQRGKFNNHVWMPYNEWPDVQNYPYNSFFVSPADTQLGIGSHEGSPGHLNTTIPAKKAERSVFGSREENKHWRSDSISTPLTQTALGQKLLKDYNAQIPGSGRAAYILSSPEENANARSMLAHLYMDVTGKTPPKSAELMLDELAGLGYGTLKRGRKLPDGMPFPYELIYDPKDQSLWDAAGPGYRDTAATMIPALIETGMFYPNELSKIDAWLERARKSGDESTINAFTDTRKRYMDELQEYLKHSRNMDRAAGLDVPEDTNIFQDFFNRLKFW